MTDHPDSKTLAAYAQGRLAPATALDVDRHAQVCAVCRAALQASAEPAAMRRVLARVERAGGHVAFEELSALADGVLAADRRVPVERHLALCGRCRREWLEIRQFAPALATPLRAPRAAADGWFAGFGRWFASAHGLRAVTAGVVAAAAATFFVSTHVGQGPDGPTSGSPISARFGGAADAPHAPPIATGDARPAAPAQKDHAVFDRLDRIAPEAVEPYRAGDFAAVAKALKPRADRGEAGARHALGLLEADGRGVPKDPKTAAALLRQAAAQGDPGAADDLAALQRSAGDRGVR